MTISTNSINRHQKQIALQSMNIYFRDLPIEIVYIDNELGSSVMEFREHTEEVGFFHKRKITVRETKVSYRVDFIFKNKKHHIYLDEEIMKNKEALLFSMRCDLGLR